MSDRSDRRERLNNLCDSLARSRMHDAANAFRDSLASFPLVKRDVTHAYEDFISGWEDAMAVRSDEMLDENRELHNIVMDLCLRLMVRRCEKCCGRLLGDDMEECSECGGTGYVDVPDEAESVIADIKEAKRGGVPSE